PLTLVEVPPGVDDAKIRKRLLEHDRIEIGGGLGKFKGRAFRIGLMGEGCRPDRVVAVLSALRGALEAEGFSVQHDPVAAVTPLLR
ncbi:MAG TPA: hypothetical protein VI299_14170, partial [Polyangiales bacterium]